MKEVGGVVKNKDIINEFHRIVNGTIDKSCDIPYHVTISQNDHQTLNPVVDTAFISSVSMIHVIIKDIHDKEYKDGEPYECYTIDFCNIMDKGGHTVFLDLNAYTVFVTPEGESKYFYFEVRDKLYIDLITYLNYLVQNCDSRNDPWYKYTPGVGLVKEE